MHYDTNRSEFPIDQYKKTILYLIEKHGVLIVSGETGSGKSTRIPQFLFSAGLYNNDNAHHESNPYKHKLICITQPRRVAATQLASRVALDLGCQLGTTVGYAVRFKDVTNHETTMIKYMTEGLLIREMMTDPKLDKYSVIIIDEVQERSLNTDIILGLLKCILHKRNDLRVIICSATADIDQIEQFFTYPSYCLDETSQRHLKNPPAVLCVRGKMFPIKIYYRKEPVANYLDCSIETAINIHETARLKLGKILIFLTGQEEVDYVADKLIDYARTSSSRLDLRHMLVLTLHASLKPEEIARVFDNHGRNTRVCIVATNVAETSLTIEDVAFVIDCGFAKLKMYNHLTGIDTLLRFPTSKSSAKQRAGRAGRTTEGIVCRLYSESQYEMLQENTLPELQRSPLAETVMLLKALGVDNIQNFPLISQMPRNNLVAALELLHALEAIDESGKLTATGKLMCQFNLDPMIAKILISQESSACTREACKIAAMLQVKDIYINPKSYASKLWSNQSLLNICASEGDMISYLNIIHGFLNNDKSRKWCEKRNLNYQALLLATEISSKLESQLVAARAGMTLTTSTTRRIELIQKSILSGLFPNAAYLHPSGNYKTVRGEQVVFVHPTSVYSESLEPPKFVIFAEILSTTKPFMRHIMSIEQDWLMAAAPHFYTFATNLEMLRGI